MRRRSTTCLDRATGPRRHHCSWWHQDIVEGYRTARAAQEARAEAWAVGYATELADFYRDVEPPLTFREWLIGSARPLSSYTLGNS